MSGRTFIITGEITARVASDFFYLAEEEQITDLVISSPGGDIGLTFGMFDVAKFKDMHTHVVGLAQSAAAVLLQAGAWRTMTNSSLLLFHSPEETCSDADFRLYTQLVEMVAQRSGLNIAEAHDLFDNKFINANRAMELGLIDEIAEDAKVIRWTRDGRNSEYPKQAEPATGGDYTGIPEFIAESENPANPEVTG
jgi:ATP-dependent protease ClpP protease subunit